MIDHYKELTPVIYDETAISYLHMVVPEQGDVAFPMHWHDRMELQTVANGTLLLYTESGRFTVTEGQTVVIGPRQLHGGFSGSNEMSFDVFMFDVETFRNGSAASEKYLTPLCRDQVFFRNVADDAELSRTLARLKDILTADAQKRPLEAIGCIYEVLGILFRHPVSERRTSRGQLGRFREILDYLELHYMDTLTLKTVGDVFGYNQTYLCRRFHETTGMTFGQYVTALRMEKAQNML